MDTHAWARLMIDGARTEELKRIIKDVLGNHYAKLTSFGKINLPTLAANLFSSRLISSQVRDCPSYHNFITEFENNLQFHTTPDQVREQCDKFLIAFRKLGGPFITASDSLKNDWIKAIKKELSPANVTRAGRTGGVSTGNRVPPVNYDQLTPTGILDVGHLNKIIQLLNQYRFNIVEWNQLGLALGLHFNSISAIEMDSKNTQQCLMNCLAAWLEQRDSVSQRGGPTMTSLIAAVKSTGNVAVVIGLEKELEKMKNILPPAPQPSGPSHPVELMSSACPFANFGNFSDDENGECADDIQEEIEEQPKSFTSSVCECFKKIAKIIIVIVILLTVAFIYTYIL
jgi:hypothetical protein